MKLQYIKNRNNTDLHFKYILMEKWEYLISHSRLDSGYEEYDLNKLWKEWWELVSVIIADQFLNWSKTCRRVFKRKIKES